MWEDKRERQIDRVYSWLCISSISFNMTRDDRLGWVVRGKNALNEQNKFA